MRQVINKMVSEDDLIRTVATAYGNGWRQVKLYFMCGLPTETDDDVLQIAAMARRVIQTGREAAGRKDIRCTVSIGAVRAEAAHAVPVGGAARPRDRRPAPARAEGGRDGATRTTAARSASATTTAGPSIIEGLLSRGDRRVGAVIRKVWEDGGRFDGWSEHFSFDRWVRRLRRRSSPARRSSLDWFTTRERELAEVLPWDHLDSGLDKDWLWEDWQDALRARRGRGLPLDALLRLRRLPDDGHRDPDRPDRPAAAAPVRSSPRSVATAAGRAAASAGRAAAAGPLRQAGPAALHLSPGLRARVRAGAAARRGPDGLLRRLQPAPQGLVRRSGADRGGVARRSTSRSRSPSGASPRRCARRWTRRCRPGWTCWRSSRRARRRWPTGSRRRAGGSSCPASPRRGASARSAAFLALDEAPVEKMIKDGPRTVDARGPGLRLADRACRSGGTGHTGRLCDTRRGRSARNTDRSTGRRPDGVTPGSRPDDAGDPAGDPAGARPAR